MKKTSALTEYESGIFFVFGFLWDVCSNSLGIAGRAADSVSKIMDTRQPLAVFRKHVETLLNLTWGWEFKILCGGYK